MIRKTVLLIAFALCLVTLPIQSQEPNHVHEHAHTGTVVQVAARYYVAVCAQKDLNQRFSNRAAAYEAAQDHARATGHRTGVIEQ